MFAWKAKCSREQSAVHTRFYQKRDKTQSAAVLTCAVAEVGNTRMCVTEASCGVLSGTELEDFSSTWGHEGERNHLGCWKLRRQISTVHLFFTHEHQPLFWRTYLDRIGEDVHGLVEIH